MLAQELFQFFVVSCYVKWTIAEECNSNLETDLISILIKRIEAMETKIILMEGREIVIQQQEKKMLRQIEYLQMKLAQVETQSKETEKRQQTMIQQLQRGCCNQQEQINKTVDILSSMSSAGKNAFNGNGALDDEKTLYLSVNEPHLTNMTERGMVARYHLERTVTGPVAFSAYITHVTSYLGIDQIIRYDGVLTNEGNAYNPLTGVFTCPRDGLYLLAFFTATVNDGFAWVKLVVDGVVVSNAVSKGVVAGNDDQGGNIAIIRLRAGQSIWTATFFRSDAQLSSTSDFRHVTLSGVRLSD